MYKVIAHLFIKWRRDAKKRFFATFAVQRSDGRVARLSSAKAATAVRIRFRPHLKFIKHCKSIDCNALFFVAVRVGYVVS
jgi:hypothetical protein